MATNGCFDLLHAGHVRYLNKAKDMGDVLIVGINGDQAVRALKGPNRPLNTADHRAEVLLGLRAVDAVCVFEDVRATRFLELARPRIYVKGSDYMAKGLNPEERSALESIGATVIFVENTPNLSTSTLWKLYSSSATG